MRLSRLASKEYRVLDVFIFLGGLFLFVGLRQAGPPWKYFSLAGILLSAVVIVAEVKSYKELALLFELRRPIGYGYYYIVISLLLGLLWGISFRGYLDIPLLPVKLTLFVFTAILTGTLEEIIFRGYIQQKLRKSGIWLSVTGTSTLHTLFKCFVILVLPPVYATNYLNFALWTFSMGCLLGLLKEYGRSTWIPVSGHAFFDLIVYGDKKINAWWIWM